MKFSEIANIFPLMDGPDFDALVDDIKRHGQREPIWSYNGEILDGRNRFRACKELGIGAIVEPWIPTNGDKPIDFVVSKNLKRRHLTSSQRGHVANTIAQLLQGEKKADSGNPLSQKEAAKLLNVSVDTVKTARKVADNADPAVNAAVASGDVSLNDAAAVATQPKPKQRRALRKVKAGKAKTMKEAIADETEEILNDDNGQEVPMGLGSVFKAAVEMRAVLNQLKQIRATVRKAAERIGFELNHFERLYDDIYDAVKFGTPKAICPICKGIPKNRKANCQCKNRGWFNESDYKLLPSEYRA